MKKHKSKISFVLYFLIASTCWAGWFGPKKIETHLMARGSKGGFVECRRVVDTLENTRAYIESRVAQATQRSSRCIINEQPQYYEIDCGPMAKSYFAKTLEFCQDQVKKSFDQFGSDVTAR